MHAQDIKDVLTVSRILNVSSDPAVVIAALIDWRDSALGVVEAAVVQAEPEPPAPKPVKAAPAKAAPKGRAKPPPPPADDDGPSPDPSADDSDF